MTTPNRTTVPAAAADDPAEASGWLRAAVMGAGDGIVSTAGLIVGVAAANESPGAILTAGLAGLVAGAMSMAAGEYVSVSAQRDLEEALRQKERELVDEAPDVARREMSVALQMRGVAPPTAREVARQLVASQPVDAGVRIKHGITEQVRARPMQAALASATAFSVGALVPIGAVALAGVRATVVSALLALGATGAGAADAGGAPRGRAALRVVLGGALAMLVSAVIGRMLGTVV